MKLTYEDYERIPDDGLRHEILDREHHVSPAPFRKHQRAADSAGEDLPELTLEPGGCGRLSIFFAEAPSR